MVEVHNINELIGIIRGVNFDGIINKKEIVQLKSWVNKNRNLVYDYSQVELIKLLDEILEDNIITAEEKKLLIRYSEKILNEESNESSKICELNGIIEGIVCDGVVNEQEVYRLKCWMDVFGDSIRDNKSSESLYKIVNDILDDGVVTEEEQEELLQILSKRISNSHFEIKLEHLKKLVKARKNIGIELIDMLDNEDAMDKIHSLAEVQLKTTLSSYTGSYVSDAEVVFISLVLIAMLKYNSNFYDNVEATYQSLYCHYSKQKIEGLIRTIVSRYRVNNSTESSRSRIINIVLSNSIVPSHYLPAFFEFIYDIYKLNFEYNLTDDLYDEFKFVYEGLRNSMLSDGDNVQLNVTKKTYKLIKSTKQLITDEDQIDSIIKLSIIIIKLIDKMIWDKELKIFNLYLKTGYETWAETLKSDSIDCKRQRSSSELRSRWEPKYIIENNAVYIVPPIHKVKSLYNYHDIRVVVFNGEEEIYFNDTPDIREIIGGYQVSIDKIKLEKPLGCISYKLLANDDVIYDSRKKLYRNFIVFDITGSEIQNNTDYSGVAIFCYKKKNNGMNSYFSCENYLLTFENIESGSSYIIDDSIFNFSSFIKPGIFGEEYKNYFIKDNSTQERISVYKNIRFLMFEWENNISEFEIVVNGHSHRLRGYKYTISERDGVNKYVIHLSIDDPGIHSIKVYELYRNKRTRIACFNFAVDPSLNINAIKLNDEKYIVSVSTDMDCTISNTEISIDEFSEDWFEIEWNGKSYIYELPFDFDIYRVSNSSWRPLNQGLWIGEVTQESKLDIYGTNIDELRIYSPVGEVLDEGIKIKDKGVYRQVPIGFIMSYKMTYDYVMLVFMHDGVRKKVVSCYNRCILDENRTELVFDPVTKRLNVSVYYNGKGKVFFTIHDSKDKDIYKSEYIKSESTVSTIELDSFEKYSICFYEKEKGLSLKKERLMKKYEKVFYAWEDFVGHSFKIGKVYFDQVVRGEFLRKYHYLNSTYIKFTGKEDKDLYTGEIFEKYGKEKNILDAINPISIEICSDVVDEVMEISVTKDGDGLFLDFEKHGIKNKLEDDFATDIFSYNIDIKEVEYSEKIKSY